ncbi:MAG: hypothetical protein JSS75_09305 [Bacteroidetes bacterium]|nr:hypothetical protein [Bacteroidota bacterium]
MRPNVLYGVILIFCAGIFLSCSNSNGPASGGNGTLALHVLTNIGGPAVGPLAGAPIQIETLSGTVASTLVSDSSGNATTQLASGAYIVHPLVVPSRPDFYHPPTPTRITVTTNVTLFDTIYYTNPIVRPSGGHGSTW